MFLKSPKAVFFIFGVLALLNVLAWSAVFKLSGRGFLEVDFFDIGQGDAIFIQTPAGHQILIDGGPSPLILEKLGRKMPFWDKSIDLVISTHPDRDHWAGLMEVLRQYEVENVLWTGIAGRGADYAEWNDLLLKEGAAVRTAEAGQAITAGAARIEIMHPLENLEGKSFKNKNDTSVVARLVFGKRSFLFTGDAGKAAEKRIMRHCASEEKCSLKADVLKISHHGSKTSTSPEFLREVSPRAAVIQVGRENRYGHPSREVLSRLGEFGIKILRTDKDGDIGIVSDGVRLATE